MASKFNKDQFLEKAKKKFNLNLNATWIVIRAYLQNFQFLINHVERSYVPHATHYFPKWGL